MLRFAVLIVAILFRSGWAGAGMELYVFFPTTTRPIVIQEKMQRALNGVSVTVFGRYNDFAARMETKPPDAVLAKTALVESFDRYSIKVRGVRKGSMDERYVIVSIDEPVEMEQINGEITVGMIDVLGRNGMKKFAEGLFREPPKIKRVVKVEDLLPLLRFNLAACMVVEDVFVDYFREVSKLKLSVRPVPETKSGIIALGVIDNKRKGNIAEVLRKTDGVIRSLFGVDTWK